MNIERCVRSILATEYRPVEVIVVDDRSSDATAEIVERLTRSGEADRLRLVRGEELPEGWFGKAWAIAQGYRVAQGDLLLFTDADTWHHPELLPRTVSVLTAERADLVSVVARQEMVTFWERLVQPHVLVALASRVGELRRVNRTRVTWDAIASGTYQSVKASVAEDVALAQAYVRHHLDIFLTHAAQFMSVRMYSSLAEIVEGWTKNLALGVPLMFPPLPLVRRAAPYLMWLPALCWVLPPLFWAVYGSTWAAVTTLVSLLIWIVVYRAEEVPVRYALLYPLGAVMVAYIMIRSAWRGSKRVQWRGRTYTPHA